MPKQTRVTRPPKKLPLVRLDLVAPILIELERRGVNSEEVLGSVGLNRATVDTKETFIHAMVIHQFLENAAAAAKDPHLSVRV